MKLSIVTASACLAMVFSTAAVAQDQPTEGEPEVFEYNGQDIHASGLAGGPVDASTMGPDCVGFIAETPNLIITVARGLPDLWVDGGDHDLTLVVVGTEATHCVDDGFNINPFINLWDAFDLEYGGELRIFVGSKDAEQHPFELTIQDGAG